MRGRSVDELERDYRDALDRARSLTPDLAARLRDYERFVRRTSHHLRERPETLFSLAVAQPKDSRVRGDTEGCDGPERPWFRLLNPFESDPDGAQLRTIKVGSGVNAVAYCELTDRHLHALTGSDDDTLRWWDVESGRCLTTLEGHTNEVNAVALSSDGRRALSGSDDRTLRWWDLEAKEKSRQCLAIFPCDAPVSALALSPTEPLVAAGDSRGRVHFFRIEGLTP